MPTTVHSAHIELDDRGVARIAGTTMKVMEVAMEAVAWGLTADQIQAGHPYLSLGQVHAALAYYHDHKAEFDAEMARLDREYDALRAQAGDSPLVKRLRAAGKLP